MNSVTPRPKCSVCDDPPHSAFNRRFTQEHKEHKLHALFDQLRDEQITIAETDFTHATYFFADWFEGAENLNKAQPENQLYSKLRAFWKRLFQERNSKERY